MTVARRPRALLIAVLAVFLAVTGLAIAGLARFGTTPDARWPHLQRELRGHVELAMRRTTAVGERIARAPEVPRALARGGDPPQALFQTIEAAISHADASIAVTIVDASGSARAWHGRPSEPARGMALSTPRYFVSTGALGLRLARVEPVVSPAGSRIGGVIVEEEISGDRVGSWMSDAYAWHGAAGAATLRPAAEGAKAAAGEFATIVRAPDGGPLIGATSSRDTLQGNIRRDEQRAFAVVLVVVALALVLGIGPLLDRRLRTRAGRQYLAIVGTIAALIVAVRALLWMATPWLAAGGVFAPREGVGAQVFLRSPGDFLLSAGALLGMGALAADAAVAARLFWRSRRRTAAAAPRAFVAAQLVAGFIAGSLLSAADWLLSAAVQAAGADTIRLSLHPLAPDRWVGFCGFAVVGAAAVWLAAAVYIAALARWIIRRKIGTSIAAPLALWAVAGALAVATARAIEGAWPSLMVPIAGLLAAAVAIDVPQLVARFRRAGVSARLSWFSLALLLPALVIYPSLLTAADRVTRHVVESQYARETINLKDDLQETLKLALREVDAIDDLPLLFSDGSSAGLTERAFAVWSQTALARERLTSSIELYGADGALLSRFALNFPEYAAAAIQATQSESCQWQLFGEVRPLGAEERRGLYAERAVCAGGKPVGSIAVHATIDYNALRFISSESPYREVFRSPSRPAAASGRPLALVIYGWSLLPIYSSGVQVWPIDEALFERVYASRDGFWTTLRNRDGEFHVYIVNDRSALYVLGYPALSVFDHFVYLAELAMMGAIVYILILLGSALETRVARTRAPGARALLRDIRASFYRKLLIAFVLAAVVPVIALSVAIRQYFANRLRADIYAEAARTAGVAQHAIEELAALLRLAGLAAPPVNDDLMVEVSQMIGRDVNLFDGPRLIATSQRDLFASGLLPTRTPEDVYREIVLEGRPSYVGEDAIGDFRYMLAAAPVRSTGAQSIATVPLASRQQEIEREIDDLDRGLLLAAVLFILMGGAIGLPTAERIADPVRRLTRASRRIAHGDFDTRVAVHSIDELRRLVDAFNSMAGELKAQQQQLERTHRLEAWAEMARQVAHEIKNPLTPIQLSAEHLRRVHADRGEPLSPVLDACVDSILQQVRLLRQIAGEFSSFAASPTPRPTRVAVAALIEEVVAPYRAGLASRIDLNVDLPPDVPDVRADPTLVGRALTNIIDNALHAMPGHGRLRIAAARENAEVAIAVSDTGVGMDADALQRVFEPYFSTKATGTGLGLTIARRNVELSGGTIAVASEKGRGTTVTIRLVVDR